MMTKQDYLAKKIAEWREFQRTGEGYESDEDFLSQTIEELWALPKEKRKSFVEHKGTDTEYESGFYDGFNYCIAEAERMRDKQIKENI